MCLSKFITMKSQAQVNVKSEPGFRHLFNALTGHKCLSMSFITLQQAMAKLPPLCQSQSLATTDQGCTATSLCGKMDTIFSLAINTQAYLTLRFTTLAALSNMHVHSMQSQTLVQILINVLCLALKHRSSLPIQPVIAPLQFVYLM